jgi:hypothetical protein
MTAATLPLQLLLLTVSGWVNRHQQDVIAYLVEENRVLKEQLHGRKLRLTDHQRRRLAAKAKRLGRRALDAVATIVTPDTLMRGHGLRRADRRRHDDLFSDRRFLRRALRSSFRLARRKRSGAKETARCSGNSLAILIRVVFQLGVGSRLARLGIV